MGPQHKSVSKTCDAERRVVPRQLFALASALWLSACKASTDSPASRESPVTHPFGFRPPPPGVFVTQALVPWVNRRTGQRFIAPTGGWQPPNDDWTVEAPDAPVEPSRESPAKR